MSNHHTVYMTSAFGSIDLKIGMSKHTSTRHFSFLPLLLLCQPPTASLAVEYPSESAPPQSEEEVSSLPYRFGLGGLPQGLDEAALLLLTPPASSAGPTLMVDRGTLPTICQVESNSLMVKFGMAQVETQFLISVCTAPMLSPCSTNPLPMGRDSQ